MKALFSNEICVCSFVSRVYSSIATIFDVSTLPYAAHCADVCSRKVCAHALLLFNYATNCTQSASQSANAAAAAAAGPDDCSGTGAAAAAAVGLNSTVPAGGLAAQVAYRKPLKGEDPEVIYVQVTRLPIVKNKVFFCSSKLRHCCSALTEELCRQCLRAVRGRGHYYIALTALFPYE
jgi:hypothetical protein